jgi:hypothetical protein
MILLVEFDSVCIDYFQHHDLEGNLRKKPKYKEDSRCSLSGSGEKLYFILTYMKENPNQDYHGELFGIGQPKVSKWVKLLIPLLEKALDRLKILPKRLGKELYMFLKSFGEYFLLMDATERMIPRSICYQRQKYEYSGKKKCHTVKNNLLTNSENRILYLSDTYPGSAHDKKMVEEAELSFPKNTILMQDLGYIGYNPQNVETIMPNKNYKNKPLNHFEQEMNWLISKVRVQVEHVMAGIKRLKIVKEKLRLKGEKVRDQIMLIACGLHNLRVQSRQ